MFNTSRVWVRPDILLSRRLISPRLPFLHNTLNDHDTAFPNLGSLLLIQLIH